MATGLENEQRELADFIRAGSTRGHQCFGSYFDESGGSCALGAVSAVDASRYDAVCRDSFGWPSRPRITAALPMTKEHALLAMPEPNVAARYANQRESGGVLTR